MSAAHPAPRLNLAPGSFPSAGARTPAPAPPPEPVPFVHPALARDAESFWVATRALPAGTVLLREAPTRVSADAPRGPTTLWFGPDLAAGAALPLLAGAAHAAAPNATLATPVRWVPRAGAALTLLALAPLRAGERVTASRVELLQSPARRAAQEAALGLGGGAGNAALDAALTAARGLPVEPEARAAAVAEMRAAFDALGGAASADAFLAGAAARAGLGASHWRVLEARLRGVCAAAGARAWADAWARLEALARAVHGSGLPPAHADAQRLTMELAGVIVRGWQADDAPAALEAAAGELLAPAGSARRARAEWLVVTLKAAEAAAPYLHA
jgi:hypothetical protein